MFGTEAIRLLRDDWKVPKMLAEELYAIFQAPDTTTSGLTATAPAGVAPITVTPNTLGSYAPALSFGGNAGDPAIGWNPNTGQMQFDAPGGFNFTFPGPDGQPVNYPIGPTSDNQQQDTSNGLSMPGQITGGSGNTYQVDVYLNGLNGNKKNVTVTQMSIDPNATIPTGTWTTVVQSGTKSNLSYSMMVPVWGADPS